MNLWRSLAGVLELEITGADIGETLDTLTASGIGLSSVGYRDDLTVSVRIRRRDYKAVEKRLEKRGDRVRVTGRKGLFFRFAAAGKRPVLTAGILFFIALTLILPERILFVQVQGNERIPSRLILEAAAQSGICFGATRREVRSEKVKNALLDAVPELKWAGVNTSGCVAVVSVRERSEAERQQPDTGVSSLVALRDGVIVSVTATDGTALCAVGQAVKAGQTLISGYTDCGILVKATRAEGEIMARTRRQIRAVTLPEGRMRGACREETGNYSLILGKKRINFINRGGICEGTCGRMYAEYYITLPGGFVLPAALAVDIHSCHESEAFVKAPEEAFRELTSFSESYVLGQMVMGSILDSGIAVQTGKEQYRLEAEYLCLEMIAGRRQERKVETNGESG